MDIKWIVARQASGALLLKTDGKTAGPRKARRVCTARDAAKRLGRSLRQVYRYIEEKTVRSYGKFLGEWLLDFEDVRKASALPKRLQSPPAHLRCLFPEYDIHRLNPYRDRAIILSRILDLGNRKDLRWAFKRYPPESLREFLNNEGRRSLPPRAFNFWRLFFEAGAIPPSASHLRGRRWGGIAS